MKKYLLMTTCWLLAFYTSWAQCAAYPCNWWTGMKWNKVQVLVHGMDSNFNKGKVSVHYPGVQLQKVERLDNGRYIALDLYITPSARPGVVSFIINHPEKTDTIPWPLYKRRAGRGTAFAQGITSADLIYLLMPDRFSNGDDSNDRVPGMRDQSLNRDSLYARHGGDLQGVLHHLDYLQDLGVTALWMTPVLENDMPRNSIHGYAITDEYKIDPRLGTAAMYRQLSDSLHRRGMKLIQDAVYNHVGDQNIFYLDPPVKDWVHTWPAYTNTSYRDQPLFDPYASLSDKQIMSNGWFVPQMPDLNQSNPYVASFLIQHAIWCVETFGIDGWRIDTYIYNDLSFMNRCNRALLDEYPRLSLFGETWVHGVLNQSYFCENNDALPFKSNLPGTTDFQELLYGIAPALNDRLGWTSGVNQLYATTAQDVLYKNPMNEVIFLDNHDLSRFFSVVHEDTAKYKMALAWLLTFRGIPQLYYGSEILMTGLADPDAKVRGDFQGGWKEDSVNKFAASGRTAAENSIFNYVRSLAHFRKTSSAVKTGRMMQYVPDGGLYTYFRYDSLETVMCMMNTADTARQVDWKKKYVERTAAFGKAVDILTGKAEWGPVTIAPWTLEVFRLRP